MGYKLGYNGGRKPSAQRCQRLGARSADSASSASSTVSHCQELDVAPEPGYWGHGICLLGAEPEERFGKRQVVSDDYGV
jgi:hypothetical protein